MAGQHAYRTYLHHFPHVQPYFFSPPLVATCWEFTKHVTIFHYQFVFVIPCTWIDFFVVDDDDDSQHSYGGINLFQKTFKDHPSSNRFHDFNHILYRKWKKDIPLQKTHTNNWTTEKTFPWKYHLDRVLKCIFIKCREGKFCFYKRMFCLKVGIVAGLGVGPRNKSVSLCVTS